MATKLYLVNEFYGEASGWLAPPTGLHAKPNAGSQFWDGDTRGYMPIESASHLLTTPAGTLESTTARTISGQTAIVYGNSATSAGICCVSLPVDAAFTLSGTVTFNLWGRESGSTVGARFLCRLYRLKPDGSLTAVVTDSAQATELGTTQAVRNWTASPTSTAFEKGDRLVLHVGLGQINDAWTTLTAAVTFGWNDDVADADGDSWIQLNENVTFQTTAPAGTSLYLRTTASDIASGGGFDRREMWTSTGSSGTTAVVNTAAGPRTFLADQWTVSAGGDKLEWYSKALDATTLSGPVLANLYALCSSGAIARETLVVELARVDNDGSNAVSWAAAEIAAGSGSGLYYINSTRDRFKGWLSGPDLGIAGGQRLRCRVYFDDAYMYGNDSASVSGETATLHYNGNTDSGTSTGNQSFLTFPSGVTLDEWDGPPGPVTTPYVVPPAVMV